MKKSFAQLKRDLQVNIKVKTIQNIFKQEFINEIRTISKVQSNAIAFKCIRNGKETNSWLWWQKASNYEYTDNTFKIFDDNKNLVFEYEILKE